MNLKKTFWILYLTIFFIACQQNKSQDSNKKIFKYNESSGISTLDPAFSKDQAIIWACNQLYNGLVQLDNKLIVKPCIAKSWEISNSGTIYTFHLRKDIYFHPHKLFKDTNRRVTAFDFVYSFKRIKDPMLASPGAWVFNTVLDSNNFDFRAIDDSTFQIKLQKPFPPFIGLLSMQYCSVVPYEVVEFYKKDFRKNPIGTGPFKFKYWKEGVKLVLVRNDNYFEKDITGNKLPYLDAVNISFVNDKQTAFLEFIKGNLDFISGIDASYKDELLTKSGKLNPKYSKKINLFKHPYLNTEYLGFLVDDSLMKLSESPGKYKKVRQAINYGFDRKKMIKYLRNNIGIAGEYGIIPVGLPSFDSTLMKGYNYNYNKAKQLLKEAGYPNGVGLPVITLSTTASFLDLCKYIQFELSEIGIKINLDVSPPATLRQMIAKSKVDFFRGSWIADYPDAENYLSLFYSANYAPKGPNYTHFKNLNYDKLYIQSLSETNDSIRYKIYQEMNNLITEESPVIILFYDEVLRFVQKNIVGLEPNALNLLVLKEVKKI